MTAMATVGTLAGERPEQAWLRRGLLGASPAGARDATREAVRREGIRRCGPGRHTPMASRWGSEPGRCRRRGCATAVAALQGTGRQFVEGVPVGGADAAGARVPALRGGRGHLCDWSPVTRLAGAAAASCRAARKRLALPPPLSATLCTSLPPFPGFPPVPTAPGPPRPRLHARGAALPASGG